MWLEGLNVRILFLKKPNFIQVPPIYFQTPLISYWVFPNIFCFIIMLITNILYLIIKIGLWYKISHKKKPKNTYFIQFYYHILFKAQEYVCLAIFEKHMIQVHGKTILSMEFKSMIKSHDLNPWQFIYPKPNFHWQYQSPILIGNIKTQFSLAISKAQLALALLKAQANYLALFYQKPKVIDTWQNTIS